MSVTLSKGHMMAIAAVWLLSIMAVLYVSTHTGGNLSSSVGPADAAGTVAHGGSSSSGAYVTHEGSDVYDWARKNGAIVNIEPAMIDKGGVMVPGAIATTDIKVGDVILSIPRRMIVTEDVARKSPIGRIFQDGPDWTEEAVFTFFVLWIMSKPQDAGQWEQYGRVLAKTTLDVPVLMSETELEAAVKKHRLPPEQMKNSRNSALATVQRLTNTYAPHIKAVQPEPWFTEDMLSTDKVARAYMLFTSRYWKLDFPNHQGKMNKIAFMAPVADMLNMGGPGTALSSFNINDFDGRGGFRFEAGVAVKQGKEVEFFYGSYCRDDLFTHYGFVTADTPNC